MAVLVLIGGLATVLLTIGMALGNPIVVSGGILALACQFMLSLYVRDETAGFAAAVHGAALLLVSEIAYLSLELRLAHRGGGGVLRRRAAVIVTLVLAALVVGASTAALSQAPIAGSVLLTAAGVGSLLAALAIVAVLLWQGERGSVTGSTRQER